TFREGGKLILIEGLSRLVGIMVDAVEGYLGSCRFVRIFGGRAEKGIQPSAKPAFFHCRSSPIGKADASCIHSRGLNSILSLAVVPNHRDAPFGPGRSGLGRF